MYSCYIPRTDSDTRPFLSPFLLSFSAYDRARRIPAWTAEHLTPESLKKIPVSSEPGAPSGGDRQNSRFREDEDVPTIFRAKLLDYFKSGYDRGHMVPAADAKSSQEAME